MSKSKLKLDITCLSSRQRRRIFLKEFYNISHMTVNSNSDLKVQNKFVNRLCGPNDIEQLSLQQNVLREINTDDFVENSDSISEHSRISTEESSLQSSISDDEFCNKTEIINDIRLWAIENYVSHSAINSLLKILIKYGHNVPTDARTVLQTPKQVEIIEMTPGKYYHAGLAEGLKKSIRKHYCRITCPSQIHINVGIDGLPLTKSSGSQFWPILASIVADFYIKPFIVGVYHGFKKPQCCNSFLKYFRDECLEIFRNGIVVEYDKQISVKITVKMNVFICDAPTKLFVKGIKGHNAYFGCGNCIQEGDYVENRVTFPEINARLRSDESFKLKHQEEHHKITSILEDLNIGIITQFPLDYMHLVLLGVMKRLLQFWIKGKQNVRLTTTQIVRSSTHLLSMASFLPKEFARKPRRLDEVDRFKATELRQLLLYTGPVIFCKILSRDKYVHFLSLSVAIRILAYNFHNYAHSLLMYFVENYSALYGRQHMSYNVHNLVHLCDYVKLWGTLDEFSAFKYENYMQKIKSKIKSSSRPLQQLINRCIEEDKLNIKNIEKNYPILKVRNSVNANDEKIIQSVQCKGFYLSTKAADNCCSLLDGTISLTKIYLKHEQIYVTGKKYSNVKSFF
ncbi:hypothetical protein ALC57_06079 [Trachymyrmex cornetzi]|uniref:DUF4806 domain-containing protein n=1 Tax=Trachymyrmex cornetzi TaxID=471704 RepID=A0A151J926_9HYME|nr:hypothetical protein ALC57_06079 [Trachymyrmex cornetzi]